MPGSLIPANEAHIQINHVATIKSSWERGEEYRQLKTGGLNLLANPNTSK